MKKEVYMAGNKDFGKHLQKLREAKGFSQEKLAELVGVEYQTISRIETGMYFTSFDNLQKISKALGLEIKDLFDFPQNELSKNELIKIITNVIKSFDREDLSKIHKMINLYFDCKK